MSSDTIKQHITSILNFMKPHWKLVNCHMVDYFTKNHWNQFVPKELDLELQDIENIRECIHDLFFNEKTESVKKKYPKFVEYLEKIESNTLKCSSGILTSKEELCTVLQDIEETNSLKKLMSVKKGHEVEIMANIVNNLIRNLIRDNSFANIYVIDAGDGKGYFSSYLAIQYRLKVLGIDLIETNTRNALLRSKKIERSCKNIKMDYSGFYKTRTSFISSSLDILNILQTEYPEINKCSISPSICLTGLHTCGNLSSSCLRIFHNQDCFKLLCIVGCCYHLIKEEFSNDEFSVNKIHFNHLNDEFGFPMSKFLKEKFVHLGRNARMLASQSIERTVSSGEINQSLFYRALLEILLMSGNPELTKTLKVGKIKNCKSFKNYLDLITQKNVNIPTFPVEQIYFLEEKYENKKNYFQLFYLLRMMFAPVIESLILLDRLLFLKELGHEKSYITSLFDAIISPRRFGIFSIKN